MITLLYAQKVIFTCNETNLMHYLSSVYSVTIPLHVLGLLVARHQEVTMYSAFGKSLCTEKRYWKFCK
jgi:hypothetical protein